MLCLSISLSAQNFGDYFQNKTLRIDYIFAGNAASQIVALDELAESDGFARTVRSAMKLTHAIDEELVPDASLIREFIEGGKYEEFY